MQKPVPEHAVLIPSNAERVFAGKIYDVYQWPQTLFDGSITTFEMLQRADTVVVLAIVDDKIILIDDEQPRVGVRRCFPGGRVDTDDPTLLFAAQRELAEETGYTFQQWRLVEMVQPHSKIEHFVYTWLAWGTYERVEPHLDAGEKITVDLVAFDEVKRQVFAEKGHLGEAMELFAECENLDDLLALPAVGSVED